MSGPEGGSFFGKIQKFFEGIFHKKLEVEQAERALKKLHEAETKEQREEDERREQERDESRAYHEAETTELVEAKAQITRERRASEILNKLDQFIADPSLRPQGADYLIDAIQRDSTVRDAVVELVRRSSSAAEAINNLLTKGRELHGSAKQLIRQIQAISYEADKEGLFDQIAPILDKTGERIKALLIDEFEEGQKLAHQLGGEMPENLREFFEEDGGIVMSNEEKSALSKFEVNPAGGKDLQKTYQRWGETVDTMIHKRPERHPGRAQWTTDLKTPGEAVVTDKIVAPLDEIWGEVERIEATGKLTTDQMQDIARKIREAESKIYPRDVPPGSSDFVKKVQDLHTYTEQKLNNLAGRLRERLREEMPKIRGGITDPEEFLKQVTLHKGRLGSLFNANQNMLSLFKGIDGDSRKFRDRVFMKIHSAILSDQRNSSGENFGLYERADFTTFIDLLRTSFSKLRVSETGQTLGQAWADHYNNLSNAVRQSRDLDYWATQPGATIESFTKSLNMFQNEYIRAATNIPAVNAAFRAYELTLRSIKDAYDGYIPPALIEYDDSTKSSFWDQASRNALDQMITLGTVADVERDKRTLFPVVGKDGHTIEMLRDKRTGELIPFKIDDWAAADEELKMYMTLAKGLGLVSARYLEIFAQAKVPGATDHPTLGMDNFHSMSYEGVAKALNYFAIYVHKWKIGSYKYFYLFNQLVPDKRKWITNPQEAARAYAAFQNGTFEKEYGAEAKRFVESTNFSGISSAIGKDTTWRQFDSTISWSDKQREFLGGPTQLALSGRYAEEAVKRFLVVNRHREDYRQELIKRNQAQPGLNLPISGPGFDKYWQQYGVAKYGKQIDQEWDKLKGRHPTRQTKHTRLAHETEELIKEKYRKAFKARVWIEMAMRNPLVVAHSLKTDIPLVGIEGEKKVKLHTRLVQEILGIPPEDTKYLAMYSTAGYGTTPSLKQREYMNNILLLETDLAAVREIAINEGRDLTEGDFRKVIKDGKRLEHALTYWGKVKEVILGTVAAETLYERFGLGLLDNGNDYAWDHQKIEAIEKTLESLPKLFQQTVKEDQEWILGTDDMSFGRMDILNLGSRHWVRRGGDIASHQAGGDAVVDYLRHGIKQNPDKIKLAEYLSKVVDGYSGDMIEIGWSIAGNMAYLTDRLFAFDWRRLGSAAQIDVWGTRRHVAAWTANGRREFWDTLEHEDVLPPHAHFYHYNWIGDFGPQANIHDMRNICHADNVDVWTEIILLGAALAIALTIYRALTAPSEEEEGGGGGGGGHH